MTRDTTAVPGAAGTVLADAVLADAAAAAAATATAAGVRVRELASLPDLAAACQLWDQIWLPGPGEGSALRPELLRALTKAGSYASGAYDEASGELVGACMGFFGPPAGASLHSHIAGVAPAGLGRGVGLALKVHQRAWCLRRGVTTVHWTFDPLIRRNAYFNLVKVGARSAEYLPNFYGEMHDAINAASETDRMLVHWDLRSGLAAAACAGRLTPASAGRELARGAAVALGTAAGGWPSPSPPPAGERKVLLVAVPADAEEMRRADPARAAAWRAGLRDVLAPLLAAGARVTGFDPAGWYVLAPGDDRSGP